ncbi:LysR substrate-binding domain-containing protein [Maritimibacter sp. UBA3975]|uniref:LysR substrate-binding domain-containing protein n=1 Tax=Maritimibacter sp. UBA3975 TaxID=1946833 RepID=UPI000C097207|nr:LysR substrate-binding domain-containing protein [Maritimibacter sp. UBA3975]MAM61146.1 LysR family transcriptional regulator [Maritimibacter sp.]|tara:strand:- start:6366 stop:7280 length:915 start_codon:yes stop_codon:yes gene_type:complete
MGRKLPPFAAVRAFEAAARLMSFKDAADELCLSPSAVSHQVRALEEFLDTRLFERRGNAMHLTFTGETYAGRLAGLLDGIDGATREARAGAQPEVLRVLCTPGFAARWMVPRMGGFAHADRLRLRVSVGAPSTDFATNDADVVIHWADAPVPGVMVEPLMSSARYPVVRPDIKARLGIETPADLCRATLMHDETMDMWAEWFELAGHLPPQMPAGPEFPNCELATTAAEQGGGVALAYDMMVRDTVASGRLLRLFDTVTMPFVIYSFACDEARAEEPLIAAFRTWLHAEVAEDARPRTVVSAAE